MSIPEDFKAWTEEEKKQQQEMFDKTALFQSRFMQYMMKEPPPADVIALLDSMIEMVARHTSGGG